MKMWTPTRLMAGKAGIGFGSNRHGHAADSTGVVGSAWAHGALGNVGRPRTMSGRDAQRQHRLSAGGGFGEVDSTVEAE